MEIVRESETCERTRKGMIMCVFSGALAIIRPEWFCERAEETKGRQKQLKTCTLTNAFCRLLELRTRPRQYQQVKQIARGRCRSKTLTLFS